MLELNLVSTNNPIVFEYFPQNTTLWWRCRKSQVITEVTDIAIHRSLPPAWQNIYGVKVKVCEHSSTT